MRISQRFQAAPVCGAERSPWPPPGCWLWPEPASRARPPSPRPHRPGALRARPRARRAASSRCPPVVASSAQCVITSTGTPVGAIKHVWLIILENKSYDSTFTGLNQNSYLWQTLPAAGCPADQLLRHRPLQHGQLHLAGVGPVPVLRRPGRLLDDGEHDQQQQRHHHHRHRRHRHRHRPHRRRQRDAHHRPTTSGAGQRQLRAATRARRGRRTLANNGCVYPTTCRPCSTSSTRPGCPGRATPRTSAVPSPSGRPPT